MAVLLSNAWVNQTANPAYQLQIVGLGTGGTGLASPPAGWGGVASQVSLSSYASTMLFTDHTCTGTVGSPASDDIAILELRANNSNQVALLAYNNSNWVIATCTGAYSTLATNLVSRATSLAPVSYAAGDTITFTARGNSYIAYHNGTEVFRWVDTSGVYTPSTDAAHNQVAIGYLWGAGTTGGWDLWSADDLYIYPALTGTAGNGALSASITQIYPPETPALSGSGTLSATVSQLYPSAGALAGSGALSATVTPNPYWIATGAGKGSNVSPITFTDTAPAGTTCTLIWVNNATTALNPTISASYGSAAATLVKTTLADTVTNSLYMTCFAILWTPSNPLPSGAQTVSFSTTTPAACGVNVVHYGSVSTVGTAIFLSNQATAGCSMSASSTNPNYLYGNGFTYTGAAAGNTFSAYNQTQRWNAALVAGANNAIIAGDAPGNGGTLTFTASRSNTTNNWGGLIVPMQP